MEKEKKKAHQERPFIFFMRFVSDTYIQKRLMVKVRHIFLILVQPNIDLWYQ